VLRLKKVNVDVKIKMSQAALKAWDTIRANKLPVYGEQLKNGSKKRKKKKDREFKGKIVKESVERATIWDRKELNELNGVELIKLARGNGKRAESNIKKRGAKAISGAIEVGRII
jgi:hypothetical protein